MTEGAGKVHIFRTACDHFKYPHHPVLASPEFSSHLLPLPRFWNMAFPVKTRQEAIVNPLPQQPNPKSTFLASTVFGIYNKPSIFELQTIITHPIL